MPSPRGGLTSPRPDADGVPGPIGYATGDGRGDGALGSGHAPTTTPAPSSALDRRGPTLRPSPSSSPAASHFLASSTLTLTICILGSSVLPVPYVFSRVGLVPGLVIMTSVAAANAYGCLALLRLAAATGHTTYEGVAGEVGGPGLAAATRVALILLLWGTLAGDFALLAEVAPPALARLAAPAGVGRASLPGPRACAAGLAALTAPLCFLPHLRSLESASAAGVGLVGALVGVVVWSALAAGAPGLASGAFPVWRPLTPAALPEAASVLGFGFFLAPLMFPLVAELPPAPAGPAVAEKAVKIVVLGVAPLVYGALGVAGPARFGNATAPSLLSNAWLGGGGLGDGVLGAAVVAYLCVSIPPIVHALRHSLDAAVAGEGAPPDARRRAVLTAVPLAAALGVALAAPEDAEAMFAAAGALPVCVLCYLLPAYLDVKAGRQAAAVEGLEAALLAPPRPSPSLVVPLAVAVAGLISSGAAAYYALAALLVRK